MERQCPCCQHTNPASLTECPRCGALLSDTAPATAPDMSMIHPIVDDGPAALELDDNEQRYRAAEARFRANQQDVAALEVMLQAAEALADPIRVSRCLATLSQVVQAPPTKADYLIRAAIVTRDQRGEAHKAAAGFRAALDHDPTRLDAFLALTEYYASQENWTALEGIYRFMIEKHSTLAQPNRLVLNKLWRKLGALLSDPIGRHQEAVLALETASRFAPEDIKNHATLFEIYQRWPGHEAQACAALNEVVLLEPDPQAQLRAMRALASFYQQQEDDDALFCTLRALAFLGEASPQESAWVEETRRKVPKIPEAAISHQLWREAVYTRNFPYDIARLLSLLAHAVGTRLENDLDTFDVTLRDRLDPEQPLLLNTLVNRICRIFGIAVPPEIYLKDEVAGLGMINGVLNPAGFLVARSLLSGHGAAELAFIVAKRLAMLKEDFYLAGISPAQDIELFLMGATKHCRPNAPITMSRDLEWIIKAIKSRLDPARLSELEKLIEGILTQQQTFSLESYFNQVDQIANRLAFLLSDSLDVAADIIVADKNASGTLNADQRLDLLVRYSVSSEYLALRKALNLVIA